MTRITAAEEYEKNPDVLKKEDVLAIQEWIKTQPHLPDVSEIEVILFLHSNYYDLEATQKTIENYYTMRSNYSEFFSSRDVTAEELEETLRVMNVAILPKRTKEGYTVLLVKLRDIDPQLSSFTNNVKLYIMMIDILLLEEGTHSGIVFVFDMEGISWGHFMRVGIMPTRKYLNYMQEAMPVRIKALMHFNLPSFFDKLLQMSKPFLKDSILGLVKFCSNVEGTYGQLPPECFPSDYPNGTAPSLDEFYGVFKEKLLAYREYFMNDELYRRVDESKRIRKKSMWNFF